MVTSSFPSQVSVYALKFGCCGQKGSIAETCYVVYQATRKAEGNNDPIWVHFSAIKHPNRLLGHFPRSGNYLPRPPGAPLRNGRRVCESFGGLLLGGGRQRTIRDSARSLEKQYTSALDGPHSPLPQTTALRSPEVYRINVRAEGVAWRSG